MADTFKVNFTEKERFKVNLTTIDIVPKKVYITELEDMSISNPANKDLLIYDSALGKWKNKQVLYQDNDYKCIIIDL